MTKISKTEPDSRSGLLWMTYIHKPVLVSKSGMSEYGRMLLDHVNHYTIHARVQTVCRGEPATEVLTVHDKYTYHPPTDQIVYPVIHTWESTETSRGKKSVTRRLTFTDYKVEDVPYEKLRLSHYGLPNELVEDTPSSLQQWLIVAAVTFAGLAAAVVFRCRQR